MFKKITRHLLNKTENPETIQSTCRQFLPAALEVEETPAHPASRVIVKTIFVLFVLALVWACFGRIDIVAVAQGKIIPGDRVKTIQPMVIGEVQTIHVQEGDEVQTGDPLITLVGTVTEAEQVRLQKEISALSYQLARQQAYIHWLDNETLQGGKKVELIHTSALTLPDLTLPDKATQAFEEQLLLQQMQDYVSAREALQSQLKSKQAEQQTTQAVVTRMQRVLPLIEERTHAMKALYTQNYGSRIDYLELEQQRIELEENTRAQQATVKQLAAEQEEIRHQLANLQARNRRESLDEQEQLHRQLGSLHQEQVKAEELHGQQQLLSPIDGTVQQLQVHTIGGVVQPAQALMQIVPRGAQMEVEAWVLNKDIGFVQEGQQAEVKIDTFNFTKYGLIPGTLTNISNDAVPDEQEGLRYLTSVQLEKDWMQVENRRVNLSPGMSVAVEVKTGQRRLIEYFLSPLLRFKQESIRER